jgi:putative phosphoesterase
MCVLKILVFSDSHGNVENMRKVMILENPQVVFFLGDGQRDIKALMKDYPDTPLYAVAGNCDYASEFPDELTLTLEGVKMVLAHGHTHGVKSGYERYLNYGFTKHAKLIFSGHTHRHEIREKRGITLINPGSIGFYYEPTYAVVKLENGVIMQREIRLLASPVFED